MQPGKIEQVGIKQMAWSRVHKGAKHDLSAARRGFLPLIKQMFDLLALQPIL